jgi:hypothetical protein
MEIIMNNWIFNAYSEVYTTAMMHDVKPKAFVSTVNASAENRFSKLVKLLGRA